MTPEEQRLNYFLKDFRILTTSEEGIDVATDKLYKIITLSLEQKRKTPKLYYSRGLIPYLSPLDDSNQYIAGSTLTSKGLTHEHEKFLSAVTLMADFGMSMFFDMNEVTDNGFKTVGSSYGAFKVLGDQSSLLVEYPYFYSLTGGNIPQIVSSFTGVTEKGSSAGTYTLVNFGGIKTPFQLMYSAASIGLTNSNGLPTGTGGNPLYFGLTEWTGITQAFRSMYHTPSLHTGLRRAINLFADRGVTFEGIIANFNPYYQFIKTADDAFMDTQIAMFQSYVGSTQNPGWIAELVRFNGSTVGNNKTGYQLAGNFNDRFFDEIQRYPLRYKFTRNDYDIGHYGIPFTTEILGWSALIPTPGVAIDATGPYASLGSDFYLNRVSGLTLYPPPAGYTYGGSSGWNSYKKARAENSSYYKDYFMLGGSLAAASVTYAASNIVPANILSYLTDTGAGVNVAGKTMNFLESYYYDIYSETLSYGGYRHMNFYPMHFVPRFNPFVPMPYVGSNIGNNTATRTCTIHQNLGGSTAERLFNLKNSISDSIHAALKAWKLLLDSYGKYDYRIMPAIRGRNEDHDLTRGGSVPYTPSDFVEYLVAPLFTGDVPANGFIMFDDVNERLLNDFYYGNIARGANEYTKVLTNKGVSGSDVPTSFIRGLETYFFDIDRMQSFMRFPSYFVDLGMTASAENYSEYRLNLNSGRFSDYRIFESNTSPLGGNRKIPYGFSGEFRWYEVPLNRNSILFTDSSLLMRWGSTANNNISVAYEILRDAYFKLTEEQIKATIAYFDANDITTFVEYRSTDKQIGR